LTSAARALATPIALLALALGTAAAPPLAAALGFVDGRRRATPAPGAVALGTVAATTPMALTVVLASRDPAGLAATAQAVSTPGSRRLPPLPHDGAVRRPLRRGTLHGRGGRGTLGGEGLVAGGAGADGLSLGVSTDAGTASQAFGVTLGRYRERDGADVFENSAAPRVPASLRGAVTDVLGLDDQPVAAPAGLERAHTLVDAAEQPLTARYPHTLPLRRASAAARTARTRSTRSRTPTASDGLYGVGDLGGG